ncbi:MAG TPA: Ig-like domain-containing protein [Bacteroidota bacterium]|nr:Ig-like domain-containing protein [Bacteroidota bacterium]
MFLLIVALNGCKETPAEITNIYYLSDSLANPNVMPRVIFTNPADGAVGPFEDYLPYYSYGPIPRITIQFNKLINVLAIKPGMITLESSNGFNGLQLSDYSYSSGTYKDPLLRSILIFQGSASYLANRVYTVTVDSTLTDVHGNKLGTRHVFSFLPEPKFRVYYAFPIGDELDPENTSGVTIRFNSKLDTTIFGKISISPPIGGTWWPLTYGYYYGDTSTAYFRIADTLLYDTKYTVSIAPDAMDANGLVIGTPTQLSFTTAPFRVRSYGISSGGNYYTFQFGFNSPVDTSTVRSSIAVTPSGPYTLSMQTDWRGLYRYVYIGFSNVLPGTEFQMVFNTTIRSAKGVNLKTPYTYSYVTTP